MKRLSRTLISIAFLVVCFAVPGQSAQPEHWPLWENYKKHFLAQEGRIVDWHAQARTTSEGQSYGLFLSLVANDRASFDLILKWTEVNLAQGSLRHQLPSWLWEKSPNGSGAVADSNSASDADLWISYTLLAAGEAWGEPKYSSLGMSLAERIEKEELTELPTGGYILLPGRSGFRPEPKVFLVNPSYIPPQILDGLASINPRGPWRSIAGSLPRLLSVESGSGFAMDWIAFRPHTGFTVTAGPVGTPGGSYDAIRIYLWVGMLDDSCPEKKELLHLLAGMDRFLSTHNYPPERVAPFENVISEYGPVGFSAAVLPFLTATSNSRAVKVQQERLRKDLSASSGLYGSDPRYFDQNLALFAEGWMDGRYGFYPSGRLWLKWKKS